MKYAHIVGWGSYVPQKVVTNQELTEFIDTTDDWIYTRTGIRQRHVANERETTSTLAFQAAAKALGRADMHPSQVELIIVATSTPEFVFPSTASCVQDYLGATKAGAFDLSAACSGFVYALVMGAQAIASGSVKNALIIGAETMSRVLDWEDRGTCILFGDGAGAVVLDGSSVPGGVMGSVMRSDGSGANLLTLPAVYDNHLPMLDPSLNGHAPRRNVISMNGRQVFRFATRVVGESIQEAAKKSHIEVEDINMIIPHQANVRIIEAAAKKLKLPTDRFFVNVNRLGNTSAASIPIALCDAIEADLLRPDDNIAFVGFGGGLSWASAIVKWDGVPDEKALLDREVRRVRYFYARTRSRLRRFARRVGAMVGGSPTPDARLKDADKKK